MADQQDSVSAISWDGTAITLLDQRRLPEHVEYLRIDSASRAAEAISQMVVRGAPAIGITAAYGAVLAAHEHFGSEGSPTAQRGAFARSLAELNAARPTAVNLRWAIERMTGLGTASDTLAGMAQVLEAEAVLIHTQDIEANRTMGELGAALIDEPALVLTHCNAGALATGGVGTALGVVRAGFRAGKITRVLAGETRPWLQGARLTAWELVQDGIPVALIADGAASYAMREQNVAWVIVGADRVVENGDVANKIGTYSLAVNARHHGVKFMVVAPTSTVDMSIASGVDIPIEKRDGQELLSVAGRPVAPVGADAWNPVFDVTPADLIDALVTEKGVVLAPTREKMRTLMA